MTTEGAMSAGVQSFDVVVVGCGIAGLSAAVAARQQGATVAVLERAPIEERGGNTRHTGAWMRMKNDSEVSDDFEEHFAANGGGYIDPSLLKRALDAPETQPSILRSMSYADPNVIGTFAYEAPQTLAWLKTFGIRFIPLDIPFPTSVQPRIQPSGGGLALIEALAQYFERNGGQVFYETAAQRLIENELGEVVGIKAVARNNQPVEFRAGAVILGCGGFEGNAEMMTHYLGQRAVNLRAMSTGCHYNKGEGIRMALEIGAAPCGDFGLWHASPMDPRSNRAGASMYIYPYRILVNNRGHRFVNEAPGLTDETYESVAREISVQPNGISYVIINNDGDPIPNLYAAGETMGIYYGAYTGATSVLKGAVFGRIAGIEAAGRRTGKH